MPPSVDLEVNYNYRGIFEAQNSVIKTNQELVCLQQVEHMRVPNEMGPSVQKGDEDKVSRGPSLAQSTTSK